MVQRKMRVPQVTEEVFQNSLCSSLRRWESLQIYKLDSCATVRNRGTLCAWLS